jgi:nucleoside-diphosphate-sugar epimerase
MAERLRTVVLGMAGSVPFAGVGWQTLHYLEGLQRLGHEVHYVEDTQRWPYDPAGNTVSDDASPAVAYVATLMRRCEDIPMSGDGGTERDYTWIDDILDGVMAAIARTGSHPGEHEIINLGESRTTSLSRLIELIGESLDTEPTVERHAMQPGDVLRTYADVSRARELLGYRPTTPVEEGIPRFAEWLRGELNR